MLANLAGGEAEARDDRVELAIKARGVGSINRLKDLFSFRKKMAEIESDEDDPAASKPSVKPPAPAGLAAIFHSKPLAKPAVKPPPKPPKPLTKQTEPFNLPIGRIRVYHGRPVTVTVPVPVRTPVIPADADEATAAAAVAAAAAAAAAAVPTTATAFSPTMISVNIIETCQKEFAKSATYGFVDVKVSLILLFSLAHYQHCFYRPPDHYLLCWGLECVSQRGLTHA